MPDRLIPPHGGTLVDLMVSDDRATELKKLSAEWPSWDLTGRQQCDLELLASGGSKSPEELGAMVGLDLADPAFWDGGLAIVGEQLDAAEQAARDAGRV